MLELTNLYFIDNFNYNYILIIFLYYVIELINFILKNENIKTKLYKVNNTLELLTNYVNTNTGNPFIKSHIDKCKNSKNNNQIEIDPYIYNYLNSEYIKNKTNLFKDIYNNGVENGLIYSAKQIMNYDNTIKRIVSLTDNKLYIEKESEMIDLKSYVNELYNYKFEIFINDITLIKKNYKSVTETVIFTFIGNVEIGKYLIKKILNSDKYNLLNIFIFNINIEYKQFDFLLSKFNNKIIFISKEYGNDIIPTLQAFNKCKELNFKYVIKLHTKGNIGLLNKAVDCLLFSNVEELLEKRVNCNCIGHGYINIKKLHNRINNKKEGFWCDKLINKYKKYINKELFIYYTIFLSDKIVFNKMIEFISKNNYRSYFLNNMYDTHEVNIEQSPIHFLERLFGIIDCKETYNIISKSKTTQSNNLKNICIFHCGNFEIFYEIIQKFPTLKNCRFIITYYNNYLDSLKMLRLDVIKYFKVENKGTDCGPFLLCLKYLLDNKYLYDKNTLFYKIHTKSIKDWRNTLIQDILNFSKTNLSKDIPIIIGSQKYIYSDRKGINKSYIIDIIKRNKININTEYFYDIYYDEFVSGKGNNKFTDLYPSLNFYRFYEPDLYNVTLEHWYNYGINEFHRKSNINYIKNYAIYSNNFIAGTIFAFNLPYLNLFKQYNLEYEYSILERGYLNNLKLAKTHSWEYFFGLIVYINNGIIFGVQNKNIITNKIELLKNIPKYSIINVPYEKSKIAIFMLIPGKNPDSGGYRTLLNYINYLNINGYSLDIYFGMSWNDEDIKLNINDNNNYGMPLRNCDEIYNSKTIYNYINNIKKYNVININKNNFYLGLKCQKKYKILLANAWQIAEAVYANKAHADKLIYIIQDREALFYPNDKSLQNLVIKTYKKDYHYYCITKYLGNYFKKYTISKNITSSIMGVKLNIYKKYISTENRTNSVVIPYYKNIKPNRKPDLVRKIIKILSSNGIKCFVYPFNFEYTNKNIINLGVMSESKLNELYNQCKVGIIFSNSNPSRLGFEMYASGLQVIEYKTEFTKYDMPDKYFVKITNENNILNIVKNLFNKDYDNSFLQNIDINNDFKNFEKFINQHI